MEERKERGKRRKRKGERLYKKKNACDIVPTPTSAHSDSPYIGQCIRLKIGVCACWSFSVFRNGLVDA
jgi:hypothetical protein